MKSCELNNNNNPLLFFTGAKFQNDKNSSEKEHWFLCHKWDLSTDDDYCLLYDSRPLADYTYLLTMPDTCHAICSQFAKCIEIWRRGKEEREHCYYRP